MRKLIMLFLIPLLLVSCTNKNYVKIEDELEIIVEKYDADKETFTPTVLQLNEPITIKNGGSENKYSVHVQLCMEGGEFTASADNEDAQLSVDANRRPWIDMLSEREFGYSVDLGHEGYFSICMPTSKTIFANTAKHPEFAEKLDIDRDGYYVGTEYYITVKAYKNLKHVVTAQLKFTQIQDFAGNGFDEKADFTVELVSYQYSYMFDMM